MRRREFLAGGAATLLAGASTSAIPAFGLAQPAAKFAWLADGSGIHTLSSSGGEWKRTLLYACAAPLALARLPQGHALYAAHGALLQGHRPCGYVGSYSIEPETGRLHLLHQEALALACTEPDALAVSPDGKLLAAASSSAGLLNLVPLDDKGRPQAVSAARKELRWLTARAEGNAESGQVSLRFPSPATLVLDHAGLRERTVYRCSGDGFTMLRRTELPHHTASGDGSPIAGALTT